MADYRAAAAAAGIPADDVQRALRPLEALEALFRPLAASLRFDEEPATTFAAPEEGE